MKRALQKPALLAITVLFLVTGGGWSLRGNAGSDPAPQASKMDEPASKPAEALQWQKRALLSPRYEKEKGETARRRVQLYEVRKAYHEEAGPSYNGPKSDQPATEKDSSPEPFPTARMLLQRLWR
jgi:hypothetical protein